MGKYWRGLGSYERVWAKYRPVCARMGPYEHFYMINDSSIFGGVIKDLKNFNSLEIIQSDFY